MVRGRRKSPKLIKVEIVNEAISISLSYDPVKLLPILVGVSVCDEMRRQLIRRKSGEIVRLFESVVDFDTEGESMRKYIEFDIRLEGTIPSEYIPLREWPELIKRLGVYVQKDEARLAREAKRAERFIREQLSYKLIRSLRQLLFEGLLAATGGPVSEEQRRELENLGTMVGRSWELREAGLYGPSDLKRWGRKDLEQVLNWMMSEVGRNRVTYDKVAAQMQKEFAFTPTLTGETLRKAVSHHGLNWKDLKKRKN